MLSVIGDDWRDVEHHDARQPDIFRAVQVKVHEVPLPVESIGTAGAETNTYNAGDFQRVVGIPIAHGLDRSTVDAFRARNLGLVTTLRDSELGELRDILENAESGAVRVEDLRDLIVERFGVADSRAELIARDQVLKLNSDLTQLRQTSVGITRYRWSTSLDERVRPDHGALEGTEWGWGSPPVVDERTGRREPPGRDFQCRCVPIPVLDDNLDV